MNNKNLMIDLIEKQSEELQLDMVIEKSLMLSLSLQKFKRTEFKEDFSLYSKHYNDVCEKIADMKIMIEQCEFLFNSNEIDKHYHNKIEKLKQNLNVY